MTPLLTDRDVVHAATVNSAEAVCPPVASVATREPAAPPVDPTGIVMTQVNAPAGVVMIVAPAVPTLQLIGVIAMPSNARVTPEETANPVPVTVTLVPMTPLVTERGEMVHEVTVNGADVVWPHAASVATKPPAPAVDPPGTANVQTNPPAAVVVMVAPV